MLDYGLVSIILPTYNTSKYIRETIESVLNQTYTNWELIVTDDCSSDGTVQIVEEYIKVDQRIKLFKLNRNSGAAVARNCSIDNAQGRYIAFIDSDDWWYPNKLEMQLDFMSRNHYEFVFSAFEYADELLKVIGVSFKPKRISFCSLKRGNSIGTPGVLYDTQRIGKVFMPNFKTGEDWATWLQIVKLTKYAYSINQPLWKYRLVQGSLSSDKMTQVYNNIKLYRQVLGYSILTSLLFFIFVFIPNHLLKVAKNKVDGFFYLKKINITNLK